MCTGRSASSPRKSCGTISPDRLLESAMSRPRRMIRHTTGAWQAMHSVVSALRIKDAMTIAQSLLVSALWLACLTVAAATGDQGVPCESRDLAFNDKRAAWSNLPLSKLKRDTVYSVVQEGDRSAVLRATADRSASLYVAPLQPALRTPMTLRWDWKTDALITGADNRAKDREDAPLRVLVAFDGDVATLPDAERKRVSRAKNLAGRDIPYAVLMYIWTDHVPAGTVIPSAHTSQVKMLAVASGPVGLGRWQTVQRNVADDYRKAYGTEPGPVLAIAVMTDTDNTGATAVGSYAGIRIDCGNR